jgi:hypothetical protein
MNNNLYDHDDSDSNYDSDGNSIIIYSESSTTNDNENNSDSNSNSDDNDFEIDEFNFDILSINGNFEYDEDDPDNIITEHISALEDDYLNIDRPNNSYLIGMAFLLSRPYYNNNIMIEEQLYLVASHISAKTFYKFNYSDIKKYLFINSTFYLRKPQINIIKLYITEDGMHTCIIKTFWLKIVQRRWKKIYALRLYTIKLRGTIVEIRWHEIHGTYSYRCRLLPGLIGMMS